MDVYTDKSTKRTVAETRQAERKIQGNRRDRRSGGRQTVQTLQTIGG
jgi:hypothetical protein